MGRIDRLHPAPALSPQPSVSLQLEQSIQMNLRSDLAQFQQHIIQNQTTTMQALRAKLMNRTTDQTHKLTAVEAQVTGEPPESQAGPPGFQYLPLSWGGSTFPGPRVPWPPLPHSHIQSATALV